jgi:hypothetical protein
MFELDTRSRPKGTAMTTPPSPKPLNRWVAAAAVAAILVGAAFVLPTVHAWALTAVIVVIIAVVTGRGR